MPMVREALVCLHNVEVVSRHAAEAREDVDLELALLGVGRNVLEHLQSHHLIRVPAPALEDLPKCTPAQHIQHLGRRRRRRGGRGRGRERECRGGGGDCSDR